MRGLTRGNGIIWKAALRGPGLCAASNFRAAILAGRSSCKIRKEFEALEDIALRFVVFHGWMPGRGRLGPGGIVLGIERGYGHFQRSTLSYQVQKGTRSRRPTASQCCRAGSDGGRFRFCGRAGRCIYSCPLRAASSHLHRGLESAGRESTARCLEGDFGFQRERKEVSMKITR